MSKAKKKIIFIINSAQNQRCIKRVNEFVSKGYEVEAYAFSRGDELRNQPLFDLILVGQVSNDTAYIDRLKLMFKAIRDVIRKHKKENVIYYLFSLDVAIIFCLQSRGEYFYEESDLVHTYVKNGVVKNILKYFDKKIIKNSLITVFTSEGFIKYHFISNSAPQNVLVVPNRLSPNIIDFPIINKRKIDIKSIRFGFVGAIRFKSLYCIAKTILETFPNHEFHFFGTINSNRDGDFEALNSFPNCFFHGAFKNPNDLPLIYSKIDLLISTYDLVEENVKYAEPNKLYESIYFETPIIVTSNTFLAEKINQHCIGYDIDAMNPEEIILFVTQLSEQDINKKISNCKRIEKKNTLNLNDTFFNRIETLTSIQQ